LRIDIYFFLEVKFRKISKSHFSKFRNLMDGLTKEYYAYFCSPFGLLPAFFGFKMRAIMVSHFSKKRMLPRGRLYIHVF